MRFIQWGVWLLGVLAGMASAAETLPASRPAVSASAWSAASEQGLQTRLVAVTKNVRAGRPVFVEAEVRAKDGKEWAQATEVTSYTAKVIVRDKEGTIVDTLETSLKFQTMVPAGAGASLGVYPAGKASANLPEGKYSVTVECPTTPELLERGMVQLPAAGPLEFEVAGAVEAADETLRGDAQQAEELARYLRVWSGLRHLPEQGKAISPGLVGLIEKGDEKVSEALGLPQWQYAAFVIGQIGDERAEPFLLARLEDTDAMSFYFVKPLGDLRIRAAVPRLVRELQAMDVGGWEITSSAWGSKATYLVETLERITGERFARSRGGGRWPDKGITLKSVNEWWAKQDAKSYAPAADTKPAGG